MNTQRCLYALLVMGLLVSGCRERAPEKPADPPLPTTTNIATDVSDEKPAVVSRINANGRESEYRAYFERDALARIAETYTPDQRERAEYEFQGARLMKFSSQGATSASLELDAQGRVQRAQENGAPLAPERIEAIRARANMLRSHALAQHASRSHATY